MSTDPFPADLAEDCPDSGIVDPPSYYSMDGETWTVDCGDAMGMSSGIPAGFWALFLLVVLAGVALTVWRVSTARRMARESGMNVGDATAMTLLEEDGLSATYLASNLRGQAPTPAAAAPAAGASAAERLRELADLLRQGLITQAEHDERRARIIDGV